MPACPKCQAPYDEGQHFCKDCGARLPGAESPAPSAKPRAPAWVWVLLVAVGVGLIVLLVLLFSRPASPPPAGPAPAAQAPAPGVALEEQLMDTLNTLREAQLKQDLALLVSCFSPAFPGLEQKKQGIQKEWQEFTFTNMFFFLEEVTPKGADQAVATVSWDVQAQEKSTQEYVAGGQTYRVGFEKAKGRWVIRFLEELAAK